MPVHIENDVRACLTWETTRLGLRFAKKDAAYLYLGRAGIGFSNMVAGEIVRGVNNAAGEIEEVYIGMDECLNEHLMEASMVQRARRFSPTVSSIGDILKANRMGLTWARLLVDDFVGHLRLLVQLIRAMLDPDCIILGGDITDALRATPGLLPEGDYTFGERFEDACALGAAAIALRAALYERIDDAMGDLD
jgi:predicted NBD/HSP70 family sugar kinase